MKSIILKLSSVQDSVLWPERPVTISSSCVGKTDSLDSLSFIALESSCCKSLYRHKHSLEEIPFYFIGKIKLPRKYVWIYIFSLGYKQGNKCKCRFSISFSSFVSHFQEQRSLVLNKVNFPCLKPFKRNWIFAFLFLNEVGCGYWSVSWHRATISS